MFDKSDRLTLYTNVLIAAFGIFVVLFTDYLFSGLIFSLCALLLLYIQYRQSKTAFTISSLERVLTIDDSSGSKATETQNYAIITNHSGHSAFWCKNIRSDGFVSYININGMAPAEQIQEDGSIQAAMTFESRLKTGQPFDLLLTFNHRNAFTGSQGVLAHTVDQETNRLHLVVELPKGRPVTSAKVFRKYEGVEKELLPPIVSEHGRIEAEIKNPLLGAEYYLQWDWPKEGFVRKLDRLFIPA